VLVNSTTDRASLRPMARSYTDEEKRGAVATYVEHGLDHAHQETGVAKSTLRDWATKAGHDPSTIAARFVSKTRAATEAASASAEEKRVHLQAELLDAAREHVAMARVTTDGKDAQHWMTAAAIGVDKFRLERGEATDRTETVAAPERTPEVEAELAKVVSLADRRAA
jgi:transposase-like protein